MFKIGRAAAATVLLIPAPAALAEPAQANSAQSEAAHANAARAEAAQENPASTEAFNPGTGVLDVDYAGYLAQHDVVYNSPQTDPLRGLPVGNGRTGAMVWSGDGLTMQVSGVDLSGQSAYAAGLVSLGLDEGSGSYQQRLSLYDGTLVTKEDQRTVTVLGVPGSEAMGIHVEDPRPGSATTALELSLWPPGPGGDSWQRPQAYADAAGAGLSRGQDDPAGFGYTLAATVDGAAFTTQVVDDTRVRLTITPTPSYTVWFTAAARIDAPDRDSGARARGQLAAAGGAGYLTTLGRYRDFWHDFWRRSFVQYRDGGDYLENLYYLGTYVIAAGAYGTYPVHAANGVFRAAQDTTSESAGYRYRDERAVYAPLLAGNHADLFATLNGLYARNAATLNRSDGLWVPATMSWDGRPGDSRAGLLSTGAEVAYGMYLQYRYTGDAAYLRDTAYPFVRDVLRLYLSRVREQDGEWILPSSDALDTYRDVRDAATDLAAIRLLAPIGVMLSAALGVDAGLRGQWLDLLGRLHPYQVRDGAWRPHDPPAVTARGTDNVAAELIWPFDATGLGASDYGTALATWKARPYPDAGDAAVQAARLGLGDEAQALMKAMLQRYQTYPNGLGTGLAYLGNHLSAVHESLLQSYDGRIRVFPAVPGGAGFAGRFTLLAQDGFLVSSERQDGDTAYIGLKSLEGRPATVVNPWPGEQVRVRRAADGAILATTTADEAGFATQAGGVYIVERAARPLGSAARTTLTGARNDGAKTLPGTTATLGGAATLRPRPTGGSALRARANSRYVTASYGGTAPLVAGRSTVGTAETFDIIDLPGGDVALRARVNGRYVCAEHAGANPLIANRAEAGAWERFELVHNPDGSVSLKAAVNGRYVTAEGAGAGPLIANRDAIGPWERYDLVPQ
ncbi:carbohydrate-binding protein [Dactylosporangium sp. CA-139066]|uniref:fascin domain-containing protein n=1 Tax=Dactylosporangium sp. CA-139066 TaxID=3239930 RepID=UPI003D94B1F0